MDMFYQRGQIGLVVLLISTVLVTLGLGVATQSVFETKSARQETSFTETFNVAEQSIEELLRQDLSGVAEGTVTLDSVAGFNRNATLTHQKAYTKPQVKPGESVQVNLQGASTLKVTWTDGGAAQACTTSGTAVIVTLISNTGFERYAVGRGCPVNRSSYDSFDATTSIDFSCDASSCTRNFPLSNMVMARIRPVYAATNLTIDGSNLPVQNYLISSNASMGGQETVSLEVNKPASPSLPSIFDYVLFSASGNLSQ